LLCSLSVQAKPIGFVEIGPDLSFTITDEECKSDVIVNLPGLFKMTNKGVVTTGCYGVLFHLEIVLLYVPAEKGIIIIPLNSFTPIIVQET
jgi:hypothetical protein